MYLLTGHSVVIQVWYVVYNGVKKIRNAQTKLFEIALQIC